MKTLRNILVVVFLVCVVVVSGVRGAYEVYSFEDLVVNPSGGQEIQMSKDNIPYDNLGIRDINSGSDSDVGVNWHIGFVNYEEVSPTDPNLLAIIVGYAKGIYPTFQGYEGYMSGYWYEDIGEGNRPDDIWIIYDQLGDGMGLKIGSFFYLGLDDILYTSVNVEFDGVWGDVSKLPTYAHVGDPAILPHMVVIPLHAGPYNMNDLADLAYYWLSGCDESNDYCEGLDFNYDGTVNFVDFTYIANEWNPDG